MDFASVAAKAHVTRPEIVGTLFKYANDDNYTDFNMIVNIKDFDTTILKEVNENGATMIHVNCMKCNDIDINILRNIGSKFGKTDSVFYLADYETKTLVDYYHQNVNQSVKPKIAKFIADHTLYSTEILNLPTRASYKF
jgi:hypothetical protein